MRKIDAVVLLEKAAQMYILEIDRVERAGLSGLFSMFKEVSDIHEMACEMVEDTFKFRVGGEMVDTFTDQVEGILYSDEAEMRFANFAIGLNADMAKEISMRSRIEAAVKLAQLNISMVQKMIKVGEAGVDMRDLFGDDYIYICIRKLCGFEMLEKYVEFLGDPFMSPEDLFDDLIEMEKLLSER